MDKQRLAKTNTFPLTNTGKEQNSFNPEFNQRQQQSLLPSFVNKKPKLSKRLHSEHPQPSNFVRDYQEQSGSNSQRRLREQKLHIVDERQRLINAFLNPNGMKSGESQSLISSSKIKHPQIIEEQKHRRISPQKHQLGTKSGSGAVKKETTDFTRVSLDVKSRPTILSTINPVEINLNNSTENTPAVDVNTNQNHIVSRHSKINSCTQAQLLNSRPSYDQRQANGGGRAQSNLAQFDTKPPMKPQKGNQNVLNQSSGNMATNNRLVNSRQFSHQQDTNDEKELTLPHMSETRKHDKSRKNIGFLQQNQQRHQVASSLKRKSPTNNKENVINASNSAKNGLNLNLKHSGVKQASKKEYRQQMTNNGGEPLKRYASRTQTNWKESIKHGDQQTNNEGDLLPPNSQNQFDHRQISLGRGRNEETATSGQVEQHRDGIYSININGGKRGGSNNNNHQQRGTTVTVGMGGGRRQKHQTQQQQTTTSGQGQSQSQNNKMQFPQNSYSLAAQDRSRGKNLIGSSTTEARRDEKDPLARKVIKLANFHQIQELSPQRSSDEQNAEKVQYKQKQEQYRAQLQELASMGNEIAKLKSENRQTKTNIQRLKSFQARKQMRMLRDKKVQPGSQVDVMLRKTGFDFKGQDKQQGRRGGMGIYGGLMRNSQAFSEDSENDALSSSEGAGQYHLAFQKHRQSLKNAHTHMMKNQHKQGRVAGKMGGKQSITAKDFHKTTHLSSKMANMGGKLFDRLQGCEAEGGFIDPSKMFAMMNEVQVEEDPEAYVPDIEKQHIQKQKVLIEQLVAEDIRQNRKWDADKALFDFDDSIDNLSMISDRYALPNLVPEGQKEEKSQEEQDADDQEQGKEGTNNNSKNVQDQQQAVKRRSPSPKPQAPKISKVKNGKSRQSLIQMAQHWRDSQSEEEGTGDNHYQAVKMRNMKSNLTPPPNNLPAKQQHLMHHNNNNERHYANRASRELPSKMSADELKDEIIKELSSVGKAKNPHRDSKRNIARKTSSHHFSQVLERHSRSITKNFSLASNFSEKSNIRKDRSQTNLSALQNKSKMRLSRINSQYADIGGLGSGGGGLMQRQQQILFAESPAAAQAASGFAYNKTAGRSSHSKIVKLEKMNLQDSQRNGQRRGEGGFLKTVNTVKQQANVIVTGGTHSSDILKKVSSQNNNQHSQMNPYQIKQAAASRQVVQKHQHQNLQNSKSNNVGNRISKTQIDPNHINQSRFINGMLMNINKNGGNGSQNGKDYAPLEQKPTPLNVQNPNLVNINISASRMNEQKSGNTNYLQQNASQQKSNRGDKQHLSRQSNLNQKHMGLRNSQNGPILDKLSHVMPLFQVENPCKNGPQNLNNSQNSGAPNIHLSNALSEVNFQQRRQSQKSSTTDQRMNSNLPQSVLNAKKERANSKRNKLESASQLKKNNQRGSTVEHRERERESQGESPRVKRGLNIRTEGGRGSESKLEKRAETAGSMQRVQTGKPRKRQTQTINRPPDVQHIMSSHGAGTSASNSHRHKTGMRLSRPPTGTCMPQNLIGSQPHINRLKKFICDNLDKQNNQLAGQLNFNSGSNFASNLKSLVTERLNSAHTSTQHHSTNRSSGQNNKFYAGQNQQNIAKTATMINEQQFPQMIPHQQMNNQFQQQVAEHVFDTNNQASLVKSQTIQSPPIVEPLTEIMQALPPSELHKKQSGIQAGTIDLDPTSPSIVNSQSESAQRSYEAYQKTYIQKRKKGGNSSGGGHNVGAGTSQATADQETLFQLNDNVCTDLRILFNRNKNKQGTAGTRKQRRNVGLFAEESQL